jgi:adenylate kinase
MADFFDKYYVQTVGSSHLSALDEQEHGSNADWRAEALGRSPWVEDPWAGDDRLLTFKSVVLPHAELLMSDRWPDADEDERHRQQRQFQCLTDADETRAEAALALKAAMSGVGSKVVAARSARAELALDDSIALVVAPGRWDVEVEPASRQRTHDELSAATADTMALVAAAEAAAKQGAARAAAQAPVTKEVGPMAEPAPEAQSATPATPGLALEIPALVPDEAAAEAELASLRAEAAEMAAAHDLPVGIIAVVQVVSAEAAETESARAAEEAGAATKLQARARGHGARRRGAGSATAADAAATLEEDFVPVEPDGPFRPGFAREAQAQAKAQAQAQAQAQAAGAKTVVVLLGPPCSGKRAHAHRIAEAVKLPRLSLAELLGAAAATGAGDVPEAPATEDLLIDLVHERLRGAECARGIVLEGFPPAVAQAEQLDALLAGLGEKVTVVIALEAPDSVLAERVSGRWVHMPSGRSYHGTFARPRSLAEGSVPSPETMLDDDTGEPLAQLPDDTTAALATRLQAYREQAPPLMEYYEAAGVLVSVDASAPQEEVWASIDAVLPYVE